MLHRTGHEPEPLEPRLIDRLVDDELSEEERAAFLTRLDDAPDGWRACALAFLEAQAWRQACGAAVRGPALSDASPWAARPADNAARPAERNLAGARQRFSRGLWTTAALAACFLIAFNVGLQWRGGPAGNNASAPSAAQGDLASSLAAADGARAPGAAADEPASQNAQAPFAWVGSAGDAAPETLDESLLRELRRMGYRIERQQRLMPIETPGGQRMLVPVQQLEFRLQGNSYQ